LYASQNTTPSHANAALPDATEDATGDQNDFAAVAPVKSAAAGDAANATFIGSSIASTGHSEQKPLTGEATAPRGDNAEPPVATKQHLAAQATAAVNKPGEQTGGSSHTDSPSATVHAAAADIAGATTFSPNTSHVAAQISGADGSMMVRDAAGAHGAVSTFNAAGGSSAGTPPAAQQEPFAALDAGTGVSTPNWVHAGGRQAEAGFEDPALGWVGVRADLSSGGVHAAIVAGSSEAAQTLSGHLAGLNAYLSENHTPVSTLTMDTAGYSGSETGQNQGMNQGTNEGMQQSAGQPESQSGHQPANQSGASVSERGAQVLPANSGDSVSGLGAIAYVDGRGAHISVMA
jgi:hypothetical protein